MPTYYGTFENKNEDALADKYVEVIADDFDSALTVMKKHFEDRWSGITDELGFEFYKKRFSTGALTKHGKAIA
jgi:hypothetical protein